MSTSQLPSISILFPLDLIKNLKKSRRIICTINGIKILYHITRYTRSACFSGRPRLFVNLFPTLITLHPIRNNFCVQTSSNPNFAQQFTISDIGAFLEVSLVQPIHSSSLHRRSPTFRQLNKSMRVPRITNPAIKCERNALRQSNIGQSLLKGLRSLRAVLGEKTLSQRYAFSRSIRIEIVG